MKIIYRPELDGLRAVAVVAVIFYHAQINILDFKFFKGGFIGVDIFFVISGYLITSIILKELVTKGSFSFKHFYERRVRRILPVLLFIILVSLPVGWIYLLPNSFIDFSKSILYSLGFSSNFYFYYSGIQYNAESGLLKPFLHTWSLSVEEQFYILFPIVLFISFKYFRKYLIYILILGFGMSLGLSEWGSKNHPSLNFYVLPTRGWELLAGSILAYFEINNGHRSKNKSLNSILPSIGFLLIMVSFLFFNYEMFHPSFYTLFPVIGVCLIIWFSDKHEFVTKILSTKLFVGIGLISYSLYLWHYPIFAFDRIIGISENNIFEALFIILLSLLLSIFTFVFIERPFRNKNFQFKKILIILLFFISFIIIFNLTVIFNNGVKGRTLKELYHLRVFLNPNDFVQKNNTQKIILVGDSHAQSLEFVLNEAIKKNNLSLFRFNTPLYLKDFNLINRKTKKKEEQFIEDNNKIDSFLEENSKLIVILHQRWTIKLSEKFFDNQEGYKEKSDLEWESYIEPINLKKTSLKDRQKYIREGILSNINKIINQDHKLILVYPVPKMGFHVPRFLNKDYLIDKTIPILSGSYDVFKKRNKLIFEILDSVQSPNIFRVYPHKFFCDKQIQKRCVANDENHIFYYDDNHLSIQGSKFVVDEIIKVIKRIEDKSN